MRVISGLRKGHKLKAPKGVMVRPTEDKVKESIFNILGAISEEAVILDAFGGSGGIGIEFLSRGAKTCYFVDNYDESIKIINENLEHTKLSTQAIVTKQDIFIAIKGFGQKQIKFNYIYLDPPFRKDGLIEKLLDIISRENILSQDGMIIIEHEKEKLLDDTLFNFQKTDERKYGTKLMSFYSKTS